MTVRLKLTGTLQKGIIPWTFQQSAAIHKSVSTINLFSSKKIKVLNWPANSPDLNPVGNVWGLLAKQFQTVDELKDVIWNEWGKLSPTYLESLTKRMPNRLSQVIQKFGGTTSY
ncbi:unnamed protein product [Caenorhabditis sp. 36 PRJEB53466]|nr:unnamed protein product [Caenorhabditis sp. 36 PRJEB53466]